MTGPTTRPKRRTAAWRPGHGVVAGLLATVALLGPGGGQASALPVEPGSGTRTESGQDAVAALGPQEDRLVLLEEVDGTTSLVTVAPDGSERRPVPLEASVAELVASGTVRGFAVHPRGHSLVLRVDVPGEGTQALLVDPETGETASLTSPSDPDLPFACGKDPAYLDSGNSVLLLVLSLATLRCVPALVDLTNLDDPSGVRLVPANGSALNAVAAPGETSLFVSELVADPDPSLPGEFQVSLVDVTSGATTLLRRDSATSSSQGDVSTFRSEEWRLVDRAADGALAVKVVNTRSGDGIATVTTTGVLTAAGEFRVLDEIVADLPHGAVPPRSLRISPDGTQLVASFVQGLDPFLADTDLRELARVRDLTANGGWPAIEGLGRVTSPRWLAAPEQVTPVIFMPGVLGSEIWCAPEAESPIWPAVGVSESFMTLQEDGSSNASALCPDAGVRDAEYDAQHRLLPGRSGVAESLLGVDIYGQAMTELAGLVGDANFYAFGWDWRRDTSSEIERLDALVDQVLLETGAPQVQLVAHSYGGLLAREYAGQPTRRAKLARVTTVGTPYLGAAKSAFSLLTGSETPFEVGAVGTMEFLFGGTDDLRDFAGTLRGMFNLWPSASYGSFLRVPGRGDGDLDTDGIEQLIADAGGQPALWRAAQEKHRVLWDRLDIGDLPWHAVVSGGVPTIERARFSPGVDGGPTVVGVTLAAGDGTVPLRSQTLGAVDSARDIPVSAIPGDATAVGVSQLCASVHSGQMSDPRLYALIGPWLRDGTRPSADLDLPCREETRLVVQVIDAEDVPAIAPTTAQRDTATTSARVTPEPLDLATAESLGLVDVLRFGRQMLLLVDPESGVRIRLEPRDGALMSVASSLVTLGDTEVLDPGPATTSSEALVVTVEDGTAIVAAPDGPTPTGPVEPTGSADPEPTDPGPTEPTDPGPTEPSDVEPSDPETTEPTDPETTEPTDPAGRVRPDAVTKVTAPAPGVARLAVRLSADGVPRDAVTGAVRVTRLVGGVEVRVARSLLARGRVVLRVTDLPPEPVLLRVRYPGTETVGRFDTFVLAVPHAP